MERRFVEEGGKVLEATLHHRQASLTYHSHSSDRIKPYLVHPYRLAHAQGGLYLLAYVPEYREVLRIAEKVRGPDHLETLDACYDLAGALLRERKLSEAKDLARRAADTARRKLGSNHPATQKYVALVTELETKNTL